MTTDVESTESQKNVVIDLAALTSEQKISLASILALFVLETFLIANINTLGDVFRLFIPVTSHLVVVYVVDFLATVVLYLWIIVVGLFLYQIFNILTLEEKRLQDLEDTFFWATLTMAFLVMVLMFSSLLGNNQFIQLFVFLNFLSIILWLPFVPTGIYLYITKSLLKDSPDKMLEGQSPMAEEHSKKTENGSTEASKD